MERERLTITLRKDVLKLVDQSIDGAKLRNRSHAIEYFLSQQLASKTLKVVLFVNSGGAARTSYQAGGMGMAMRIPSGGPADLKPIFQTLSSQNFTDITLIGADSTGLQAGVVDAEKFELNAKTIPLETGAASPDTALEQLNSGLHDEPFIYWDTRFNQAIDLLTFIEFHKNTRAEGSAALMQTSGAGPIGLTGQLYGSKIINVGGEEVSREGGMPLAGIFIIEPQVITSTKQKNLYREILPRLATDGKLTGFAFVPNKTVVPTITTAAVRR